MSTSVTVIGDLTRNPQPSRTGVGIPASILTFGENARLWVPGTRSRHATCTYSWMRPPSRSRRSGRMTAPEGGGIPPAGGR